jgi:hypothetical protein
MPTKNKTYFNKNQSPLWLTTEMAGTTAATFNRLYPGTFHRKNGSYLRRTVRWIHLSISRHQHLRTKGMNLYNDFRLQYPKQSNCFTFCHSRLLYLYVQKLQDAQGQGRSYWDASDAAAARGRIQSAAKRVAEWIFEKETNWFHSHFKLLSRIKDD